MVGCITLLGVDNLFALFLLWLPLARGPGCVDGFEAMMDAATEALQRWKETSDLPAGMVFDAEPLAKHQPEAGPWDRGVL